MADKKAKKAPEISKKTVDELRKDLLLAEKGLFDGTLANPHYIKAVKKEIARKLTKENQEKGDK